MIGGLYADHGARPLAHLGPAQGDQPRALRADPRERVRHLPVHGLDRRSTRCSRRSSLVPRMFVVGVAIHWVIERFEVDEFNSLLLSFGLFIIAIRLINNIWSADFRQIEGDGQPVREPGALRRRHRLPGPAADGVRRGARRSRSRACVRPAAHVLRQGAARARVRPRDRGRVRRRPPPDRDARPPGSAPRWARSPAC